ncbi:MAG: ATP-dependent helicase C-terminal domain-containing protein, partial [Pseudomonadota bacterium]
LFGALSPGEQDAAIAPAATGQRKVVLATDIAESALTIQGVEVVVDSGFARVPKTSANGETSLITVRASRANVDQRRGRAGRLGPGICYRLWDEAETRGLTPAPEPEILGADLTGLVLSLAEWGEHDPQRLTWLDAPAQGRLDAAIEALQQLGAFNNDGSLSAIGRAMAALPLPPQLAALVVKAEHKAERLLAAEIAALLSERGIGGASLDLNERLERFRRQNDTRSRALHRQAKQWATMGAATGETASRTVEGTEPTHIPSDPALVLAKGWPDRLARQRPGQAGTYLLASGRAARVEEASPLAKSEWLCVADMVGAARQARITLAAPIKAQDFHRFCPPTAHEVAEFNAKTGTFGARRIKAIGAIILGEHPLPKPSGPAAKAAYLSHLKSEGFAPTGLTEPIETFLARVNCLAEAGLLEGWPDWTVETLQMSVETWLGPSLGENGFKVPNTQTVLAALGASLPWTHQRALEQDAPKNIALGSGRKASLDWLDERAPLVQAKVQEVYGTQRHPAVAGGRVPVTVQMLSPGGKPVATTRDLPSFWTGGYQDMAKDMRGRYPKHDWPDDPANARAHAGLTKARLAKG